MKRTLATMFAALALSAPAVNHAHATQRGDLLCNVTDTNGNRLIYTFANNTKNSDGSLGGTFVETGFSKNGNDVFAPVGNRPIWIMWANKMGGLTFQYRQDPSWMLAEGQISNQNGWWTANVGLYHGNALVGSGVCTREGATTAGNVADQGM